MLSSSRLSLAAKLPPLTRPNEVKMTLSDVLALETAVIYLLATDIQSDSARRFSGGLGTRGGKDLSL